MRMMVLVHLWTTSSRRKWCVWLRVWLWIRCGAHVASLSRCCARVHVQEPVPSDAGQDDSGDVGDQELSGKSRFLVKKQA